VEGYWKFRRQYWTEYVNRLFLVTGRGGVDGCGAQSGSNSAVTVHQSINQSINQSFNSLETLQITIDVINVFTFFIQITFFTFLTFFKYFFYVFYFWKTLSNAKYEYAKIHRKILLEDALEMIFIDFYWEMIFIDWLARCQAVADTPQNMNLLKLNLICIRNCKQVTKTY